MQNPNLAIATTKKHTTRPPAGRVIAGFLRALPRCVALRPSIPSHTQARAAVGSPRPSVVAGGEMIELAHRARTGRKLESLFHPAISYMPALESGASYSNGEVWACMIDVSWLTCCPSVQERSLLAIGRQGRPALFTTSGGAPCMVRVIYRAPNCIARR
jgi:hypothetical protein